MKDDKTFMEILNADVKMNNPYIAVYSYALDPESDACVILGIKDPQKGTVYQLLIHPREAKKVGIALTQGGKNCEAKSEGPL